MIGKLTGTVASIAEEGLILDVGGVGYLVQCSASTLSRLAEGAQASLMIEMKVSEDAIKLYGFSTAPERSWFRLLQGVQNVGAKVALSLLSTLSLRELEQAVALGDRAMIGRAPGVGPKLALRIATELKDKVPAMMALGPREGPIESLPHAPAGPDGEAVSALVHLGYSDVRAAQAVARARATLGEDNEVGVLIREALKGMVP